MLESKVEVAPLSFASGDRGPRTKKQPFHVDVLSTCKLAESGQALTAAAGSIVSQQTVGWETPPTKAIAFWLPGHVATQEQVGSVGVSRKLEMKNASHVLFTDEVQDKFVSLAVMENCRDDYEIYITVLATTRTHILRWNLALGGTGPANGCDAWKNLPRARVISVDVKEIDVGCGYASETKLGDCSFSSAYTPPDNAEEDSVGTDNSWLLSATLEGSEIVLRDSQLAVITRHFRPPCVSAEQAAAAEPFSGNSGKPPSASTAPDDVTCMFFLSSCVLLVAYGSGQVVVWDLTPCVHVELPVLGEGGEEEGGGVAPFDQSPPLLLFSAQLDYAVTQVLPVPKPVASVATQQTAASNCEALSLLLAGRDGRIHHVSIAYEAALSSESGDNCDSKYSPGSWVTERYYVDLTKETRYLGDTVPVVSSTGAISVATSTSGGGGMVGAGAVAVPAARAEGSQVTGSFSSLPLAMALIDGVSTNSGESSVCVVTASAVLHLSLPSLKVSDCLPLKDVAGLSASASVTNSISLASASTRAVCVVPAFDREARMLIRRAGELTLGGANEVSKSEQLEHAQKRRQQQQQARKDKRASGVVLSQAGSAAAGVGGNDKMKEDGGNARAVLSFFLSQADMMALGRAPREDDEDYEEVEDGEDIDDGDENSDNESTSTLKAVSSNSPKMTTPVKRSPLLASYTPPATPVMQRGAGSNAASSGKGRSAFSPAIGGGGGGERGQVVIDRPVTFHSKIKSSGYGQAPNTALGALEKKRKDRLRKAAAERQSAAAVRSGTAPTAGSSSGGSSRPGRAGSNSATGTAGAGAGGGTVLKRYPVEGGLLHVHQKHNDYSFAVPGGSSTSSLSRIAYSSDGTWLGIASSSDCTVTTIRTPLSRYKGEGSFYVSHDRPVTKVAFSQTQHKAEAGSGMKQLVLSSSEDGTARLWRGGKVDGAVVEFTHERCSSSTTGLSSALGRVSNSLGNTSGNSTAAAASIATSRRNRPYSGPVVDASFYYNDKFVVLGNRNHVFMYNYRCESVHAGNDLKRLQSSGTYKLAHHWSFPQARSVTAVECVNGILSPLVFCATSSHALAICDTVSGTVARTIENAHDRAIHSIALPQPSVCVQLDQSSYNIFATAATDNCVAVWDVRAPAVCVRYTGHTNRRENVGCALSPCLRYLAVGSEDKSARLVDLRTGADLAKYTGYRDVVSSVAFHPLSPQIATASYDGSLKFYCSSSS